MKKLCACLTLILLLISCNQSKAPPEVTVPNIEGAVTLFTPADEKLANRDLSPEEFLDSGFFVVISKEGIATAAIPNKTRQEILGFVITVDSESFDNGFINLHLDEPVESGELGFCSADDVPLPKEARISKIFLIIGGNYYTKDF